MAIRMIVADMDGTLLNCEKQISARTQQAVRAAIARGALFVLSSGRMPEAMLGYAQQLSVNAPMICFNGAMTYDCARRKVCGQFALSRDDARAICRVAEQMGKYVQGFWEGTYYYEAYTDKSRLYAEKCAVTGRAAGKKLSEFIPGDVFKVLLIVEAGEMPGVVRALRSELGERVTFAPSSDTFLECVAKGVNKGAALRALGAMLGVAPSEMLAFGDEANDLPMLEQAGYGYAMANASEAIRRSVRYVAPANTEDGVAQVIERYIESGEITPKEVRN
ncbi:MAG: Cof-type HAD-IIB family hydrolase [Clostridia bacterium]